MNITKLNRQYLLLLAELVVCDRNTTVYFLFAVIFNLRNNPFINILTLPARNKDFCNCFQNKTIKHLDKKYLCLELKIFVAARMAADAQMMSHFYSPLHHMYHSMHSSSLHPHSRSVTHTLRSAVKCRLMLATCHVSREQLQTIYLDVLYLAYE